VKLHTRSTRTKINLQVADDHCSDMKRYEQLCSLFAINYFHSDTFNTCHEKANMIQDIQTQRLVLPAVLRPVVNNNNNNNRSTNGNGNGNNMNREVHIQRVFSQDSILSTSTVRRQRRASLLLLQPSQSFSLPTTLSLPPATNTTNTTNHTTITRNRNNTNSFNNYRPGNGNGNYGNGSANADQQPQQPPYRSRRTMASFIVPEDSNNSNDNDNDELFLP